MRWPAGRHRLQRLLGRVGATRPGVLAIGRVVSPLQRRLYRWTGGRLSLTGRTPVLLLTTVGRRTGTERTVPVFYLRDGDRLVVCNVNPGFERPNPWILNLRAEPRARVQIGPTVLDVVAREATPAELDHYWPRLVEVWPAYGGSTAGGVRDQYSCSTRFPPEGSSVHDHGHERDVKDREVAGQPTGRKMSVIGPCSAPRWVVRSVVPC